MGESKHMPPCGTQGGMSMMPRNRKDGVPRLTNKFDTTCRHCGRPIRAGDGVLTKTPDGWRTECAR